MSHNHIHIRIVPKSTIELRVHYHRPRDHMGQLAKLSVLLLLLAWDCALIGLHTRAVLSE